MKKMKVKRGISAKNDLTSKEGTGIITLCLLTRARLARGASKGGG